MRITSGKRLQFRTNLTRRWIDVTASEDFDTEDEYWKLQKETDYGTYEFLNPKSSLCELRDPETKRDVKFDTWKVIEEKIKQSHIKRYPYDMIFGESLTKTILRLKNKGMNPHETFGIILENENLKRIKQAFPEHSKKIEDNIFTSVCARFSESDSSDHLKKEMQKSGEI